MPRDTNVSRLKLIYLVTEGIILVISAHTIPQAPPQPLKSAAYNLVITETQVIHFAIFEPDRTVTSSPINSSFSCWYLTDLR